jgi:hypothetical protein
MIQAWLDLPLPLMFATVAGFYGSTGLFLFWLCFGRWTRRWMLTFNGAVAELFGAIMVIFGILIGFVAGDVWDGWRQAVSTVESEAASLAMLSELASASGLPTDDVRRDIRVYVTAVTEKEWPSMGDTGRGAPEARQALGTLLKAVASLQHDPKDPDARFDNLMLDMALKVQGARAARLALSAPSSEDVKWACVLLLALMGQISIAMLHLDKPRPHIAAMTILTSSIVLIIVLIAASEGPFQPPIYVRSDPIARVLTLLPDEGVPLPPPAEASASGKGI